MRIWPTKTLPANSLQESFDAILASVRNKD